MMTKNKLLFRLPSALSLAAMLVYFGVAPTSMTATPQACGSGECIYNGQCFGSGACSHNGCITSYGQTCNNGVWSACHVNCQGAPISK